MRKKTASLYELRLKFGPLKCLHYLFYPNRAVFFQRLYHFHPYSDYLAEGPSKGKNFRSARMKFGTDRLFTLQILSEPNPFFRDPCHFHRALPKVFCSVKLAFKICSCSPFEEIRFVTSSKVGNYVTVYNILIRSNTS